MTLIKTSLLNAIAVGVKILTLLVLNKILAVIVGPSGYSIIGQLQNIITAITAIASAGVGTGVTKYTAEYCTEPQRQRQVWITATFLGAVCSLIIGIFIIVFRDKLAFELLKDKNYSYIFIWLTLALFLYVLNIFFLAVLNGLKEISLLVVANIANSLIALGITGLSAWMYGLQGALVALVINQSLVCIATVILLIGRPWFQFKNFIGLPDRDVAHKLSHFTIMAVTTSVLGPLTQVLVRNIIIDKVNIDASGYWEAMTKISNLYLTIFSTTLTVYLIPKIAEIKNRKDHKYEIIKILKLIVPATCCCAFFIYTLRNYIIKILFTDNFISMEVLFGWQVIGDVARSISWIFSFYLLSQSATKKFITAEIVSSTFYVSISFLAVSFYGLVGSAIAHTFANIFYMCLLLLLVLPMMRKQ